MLHASDKQKFLNAEDDEIQGLIQMDAWKYWQISTLPEVAQLINSIWSYQCKCTIDSHLLKYKAWLCTDGQQQQYGVDFFESYAPVITWSTVWLVLLLSVLLNLHCHQVDFTQAFPQADIDVLVFLCMPTGWHYKDNDGNTDYCLELTKNLYGTKQAVYSWFLHLWDSLLSQGFQQSTVDPCLFFCSETAFSSYTQTTALSLGWQHHMFNPSWQMYNSPSLWKMREKLKTSLVFALPMIPQMEPSL